MIICRFKFIRLVILGIALLVLLALGRNAQAQQESAAAEVIALAGKAERKAPTDAAFRPVQLKDKLFPKDQFRTLENSKAKLWFRDESIVVLTENTTLEIDRYQVDEAASRRDVLLKALQGQMRFIVHKVFGQPAQPDYLIETKTTVLGIRGTDGILEIINPEYLYNLESRLPIFLRNKSTGEIMNLPPMNFVISEVGRPMRLAAITPAMLRRLLLRYQLSYQILVPRNLVSPEVIAELRAEGLDILPIIDQPPLPVFHGPKQPPLPIYHGAKSP